MKLLYSENAISITACMEWSISFCVESKANPLDGLSRRKFRGPWERVQLREIPLEKLASYASEFADMTYGRIH